MRNAIMIVQEAEELSAKTDYRRGLDRKNAVAKNDFQILRSLESGLDSDILPDHSLDFPACYIAYRSPSPVEKPIQKTFAETLMDNNPQNARLGVIQLNVAFVGTDKFSSRGKNL